MRGNLQRIKFFIGWPLSLIALFFVYKLLSTKFSTYLPNLLHSNPYLLSLSILFFLIYYLIRTYIWHQLISSSKKIKFKEANYHWAISEIKRYIPGNIWSFL